MLLKLAIYALLLHQVAALNLFNPCTSKCRCCKAEKYVKRNASADAEIEVINVDDMREELRGHANDTQGHCAPYKYVYNPYRDVATRRRVLPACVRCAECLAIAEEVRKLFEDVVGVDAHLEPRVAACHVRKSLGERFCATSFANHDLRRCDGRVLFVAARDCGQHVKTNFDGQWPTRLKNMCLSFVGQLSDEEKYKFFHQYWVGSVTTDDFLCRGDGVFRECKNLMNTTTRLATAPSEKLPTFWLSCFF